MGVSSGTGTSPTMDDEPVIEPPRSDDEDLRALGQRVRERLRDRSEAWERVVQGEGDADAVMGERIEAGDDPLLAAHARAVFEPLDDGEQEALVAALLAAAAEPVVDEAGGQSIEPAANDSGRARWMGLLAVAAAVLLGWWLWPAAVAPGSSLPGYGLETDGGLTELRIRPAAPPAELRYRADSEFAWELRPEHEVAGEVAARGFALADGATKTLPLEGVTRVSPRGAVRVAGRIDALGLSPGPWTIVLVVGRPAQLPTVAPQQPPSGDAGWTMVRLSIVIEG